MAASSKLMIAEAERRFPVRIKLGIPQGGFGSRLDAMHAWLDENCGADGWAWTPAGIRGVLNMPWRSIFGTRSSPAPLSRAGAAGRPRRPSTAPM
jgi:hypothetical protein